MAEITLRVLDGADCGRVYEQLPTPVTIGREEGNTIQINDERVSRFHVKIQADQDKIVITDLESTNGTRINGEDIQLRILRYGDTIMIGRTVLLFGSREQIAERLAALRGDPAPTGSIENIPSLDFELNWSRESRRSRRAPFSSASRAARSPESWAGGPTFGAAGVSSPPDSRLVSAPSWSNPTPNVSRSKPGNGRTCSTWNLAWPAICGQSASRATTRKND